LCATAGRLISEQVAIERALSRQTAATIGIGNYRFTTIQRTENHICAIRAFRSTVEGSVCLQPRVIMFFFFTVTFFYGSFLFK
jgi:hypothetical protein